GDYLRLSTHPASVRAVSDALMRDRGLDPNAFHHAVTLVDTTDPRTNEYLRERIGIAALNRIYESRVAGALFPRPSSGRVRGGFASGWLAALLPSRDGGGCARGFADEGRGDPQGRDLPQEGESDRPGAVEAGGGDLGQTAASRGLHADVAGESRAG